jgi:hypothetical protein
MGYITTVICTETVKNITIEYKKGQHYEAYFYLDKVSINHNNTSIEYECDEFFKEHFKPLYKHRDNQINNILD